MIRIRENELSLQDAGKHFTGVALELMPASDLRSEMKEKIQLRQLTGKTPGLLAQCHALSSLHCHWRSCAGKPTAQSDGDR
jgi:hypothetical protein